MDHLLSEHLLREHHGVVSRAQLLAVGHSPEDIRKLVAIQSLRQLRRGWYAGSGALPQVERAVRAGGALSCVSALRLHGLWAPRNWPDKRLHVRRSRHFQRHGRQSTGIPNCRIPGDASAAVKRSVDSLSIALAAAVGCLAGEQAVALMDSALNKRLISAEHLTALTATLPWPASHLQARTDAAAQSGTESLVRQRLRAKGIKLRSQVPIADVGRVDFLVGDRFVIEVDSWTYHADPATFAKDRVRDRRLAARGYVVVRLRYEEVMFFWHLVEPDIMALVRSKRHLWPRRRVS